jgi:multicomponent Na+:H+ antiporter subunit C
MTSTIVQTTTRVILPFIIVFGIYVIAFGHISPGGGFQGGMIFAGAAMLIIISYGFEKPARFMSFLESLESGGVLLFIFIGSISFLLWLPYLADLRHHPPPQHHCSNKSICWCHVNLRLYRTVGTTYMINGMNIGIILFLIGMFGMMTNKNIIKIIMSLTVAENGVLIFFISIGYVISGQSPIITDDITNPVDPLPQAMMITMIVINLCLTALALIIAAWIYYKYKTFNVEDIKDDKL